MPREAFESVEDADRCSHWCTHSYPDFSFSRGGAVFVVLCCVWLLDCAKNLPAELGAFGNGFREPREYVVFKPFFLELLMNLIREFG